MPTVGLLTENPLLTLMASFCASVITKFDEGTTFIFRSWVCVADWDGALYHSSTDCMMPEMTPSASPVPMPVAPSPARISSRPISKKHDSDTVSGSYLTRRST